MNATLLKDGEIYVEKSKNGHWLVLKYGNPDQLLAHVKTRVRAIALREKFAKEQN